MGPWSSVFGLRIRTKENGDAKECFAHSLLQTYYANEKQGLKQEWTLDDIKGASGAIFIAGADTVSPLLLT